MKRFLVLLMLLPCLQHAMAQGKKPMPKTVAPVGIPKTEMKNLLDSFSYAAGLNIAENMKQQGIEELNTQLMLKAIDDVMKDRPKLLSPEQCNMTLQQQLQEFAKKKSAAQKEKGDAFLAANKARKEVVTLPSGLQYEILQAGAANGMKPTISDTVVVDYVGTLIDGTEFDNSIKRGEPAEFPVGGVIKGWIEILQLMTKGAHWKVYIPSELAYGDRGAGGTIQPGATLVFEITLKDIKPAVKK